MLLLEAQIKLPRFIAVSGKTKIIQKEQVYNMDYTLYYDTVSMTMKDYTIPIPRWTNMD